MYYFSNLKNESSDTEIETKHIGNHSTESARRLFNGMKMFIIYYLVKNMLQTMHISMLILFKVLHNLKYIRREYVKTLVVVISELWNDG